MGSNVSSLGFQSLRLGNILSFGESEGPFDLGMLNVFIGPNGSGKSNLIDVIGLLRNCPRSIQQVFQSDGGAVEWAWKGSGRQSSKFGIEARINYGSGDPDICHRLDVYAFSLNYYMSRESMYMREVDASKVSVSDSIGTPLYENDGESAWIYIKGAKKKVNSEKLDKKESILSQRKDYDSYPELFQLSQFYSGVAIYRDWRFGRDTILRTAQKADLRNDLLEEDFSNLGLFLNYLRSKPKAKRAILDGMKELYREFTDFDVQVHSNSVQVFFQEGDYTIPATRLSDGMLRYLSLLALLCDPKPPPVICIEEPELGLHPDILPKLADKLIEASQYSQLFITTHSDILIDALTDIPECVVVCEKNEGQTHLKRLDKAELSVWLEKYRLGELWTQGHLGGNRW